MQLCYYIKSCVSLRDNIPLMTIFHRHYLFHILAMDCYLLVVQKKVLNKKYGRNSESYRITCKSNKNLKVKCDYRTVCHFTSLNLCVST